MSIMAKYTSGLTTIAAMPSSGGGCVAALKGETAAQPRRQVVWGKAFVPAGLTVDLPKRLEDNDAWPFPTAAEQFSDEKMKVRQAEQSERQRRQRRKTLMHAMNYGMNGKKAEQMWVDKLELGNKDFTIELKKMLIGMDLVKCEMVEGYYGDRVGDYDLP